MFVGLGATVRRDDRRAVSLQNKRRAVQHLTDRKFLAAVEDSLKSFEPVYSTEDAAVRFDARLGQRSARRRNQTLDFLCWSNADDANIDEFNRAGNKAVA